MTTFLLLRHAHSVANERGVLAGRSEGIELSKIGRAQAADLTGALRSWKIHRFISSPLERCRSTIEPTATERSKRIVLSDYFIEMDYGSWSGSKLKSLHKEKGWKKVQKQPLSFRFPQGESFEEAVKRISNGLSELAKKHPKETILIATHGDIIKLAVQITLDADINKFQKLIVDTCSLTVVEWGKESRSLVHFNQRIIAPTRRRKQSNSLRNRKTIGGGSGV
jgi:broad specificity phosphatase PhoE